MGGSVVLVVPVPSLLPDLDFDVVVVVEDFFDFPDVDVVRVDFVNSFVRNSFGGSSWCITQRKARSQPRKYSSLFKPGKLALCPVIVIPSLMICSACLRSSFASVIFPLTIIWCFSPFNVYQKRQLTSLFADYPGSA
jgi:hypothetical protein